MPRQAFWSANGSSWVTGSAHWVGTRPYVSIAYGGGGLATVFLSGSSSPTTAHQSVRFSSSLVSMPTDAATQNATVNSTDLRFNATFTGPTTNDGQTLYVKCLFYTASNGTGNFDSYSTSLLRSGNNTNTGSLVYRPVYELHAWDGGGWRRFDTEIGPVLNTAYGEQINAFQWTFFYTLDSVAPTGWTISVKTWPGGVETGPYIIAGSSAGNFVISTDSSVPYEARLLDNTGTPSGDSIIFTPFI